MIRICLSLLLALLLVGVAPAFSAEKEAEKQSTEISKEDREVAEMLELLELMELLNNIETVAALEENT